MPALAVFIAAPLPTTPPKGAVAKYLECRVGSPGDPTHNCLLEIAFWIRVATLIGFVVFWIRVATLIDFDILGLGSLPESVYMVLGLGWLP